MEWACVGLKGTACLLRKRVSHNNMIGIPWLFANIIRHIRGPRCTRLILEAFQVSLDLVQICFELNLVRKSNIGLGVLIEATVRSAINHYPKIGISLQS
jgi:hypothetical protein